MQSKSTTRKTLRFASIAYDIIEEVQKSWGYPYVFVKSYLETINGMPVVVADYDDREAPSTTPRFTFVFNEKAGTVEVTLVVLGFSIDDKMKATKTQTTTNFKHTRNLSDFNSIDYTR